MHGNGRCQTLLRVLYKELPTSESPFLNLQTLKLHAFDLAAASYLSIALSPGLSTLLMPTCINDVARYILGQLSQRSSDVRHIYSCGIPDDASSIIMRFRTLETFDCTYLKLSPPLLYHFAMLPTLSMLSISLPGIPGTDHLDTAMAFRSLNSLNLFNVEDYSTLKYLLCALNTDSLESLSIGMLGDSHFTDAQEFLSHVSVFINLKTLSLNAQHAVQVPPVSHSLESLYRLRSLQSLKLSMMGVGISDADIPALGKAWPSLTALTVQPNTTPRSDGAPGLTLAALPLFAAHLPSLRGLTIKLDAATRPHPTGSPARSLRCIRLSLEATPLTAETWPDVAAYISNVYPFAWGLDLFVNNPPDMGTGYWTDVARMVPVISRARQDEWERAELASSSC